MNKKQLIQKIAQLESINDQLVAELDYLDMMVRKLGFQDGLSTLKTAAQELIEEQKKEEFNDEDQNPPLTG